MLKKSQTNLFTPTKIL